MGHGSVTIILSCDIFQCICYGELLLVMIRDFIKRFRSKSRFTGVGVHE